MSVPKDKSQLENHKLNALKAIEIYLKNLIESDDPNLQGKADKLSYWFEDYIRFLNRESSFDITKFPKYKKGQIVKVHLGFNIGSEEGGLHYAMVIENHNSIKSPILNVVPLTSIKSTTDISKINSSQGQVYLGNELFRLLSAKINALYTSINDNLTQLETQLASNPDNKKSPDFNSKLNKCKKELETLKKSKNEISKMKIGSIALISQITTISKIRIMDPKNSNDVLSGIRFSNETMDKIDGAISQLFTKQDDKTVDIATK